MRLSLGQVADFQKIVLNYYAAHKRPMPWRAQPTPYFVLVSEVMLQQTQVPRVLVKFAEFIAAFPDFSSLASATLPQVLEKWSGLGYNRRAKFLWEAAKMVQREYGGELPRGAAELTRLPGIGPNTAGAILAYAYNSPVVFIETNIRTVLLHHFFDDDAQKIDDKTLLGLAQQTLFEVNPREWYWALMDYGTHLKRTRGGRLAQVKSHRPQSKFEGSRRQVRGAVLRYVLDHPNASDDEMARVITDARLGEVLGALRKEGLLG